MESWYFAYETLLEFEDRYGLLPLAEPPLRVEGVAVEPRVVRGGKGVIHLRLTISEGWHLQGPDGLRIEPTGGSEFTFEEIFLPAPVRMEDTGGEVVSGWHGTFETNIPFSVSRKASKGKRDVIVRTRYRACGEGACRPDAALSLSVPVEIA
jgi:hypothetical protein